MEFAKHKIGHLKAVIGQALTNGEHEDDFHAMLLDEIDPLRHLKRVRIYVHGRLPAKSARRLILDIAFLGRLRAA